MIKIGFTGTRQGMTEAQLETFRSRFCDILIKHRQIEFHHGDCVGADTDAHKVVAQLEKAKIVIHPPTDNKHRAYNVGHFMCAPWPYLQRNKYIVEQTNFLIACPSGPEKVRSGTWSTVRYAQKLNKSTIVIQPDGKVEIMLRKS